MFGERLKIVLENKNMTQTQLAKEINVSQQAVSRWCQGITEADHKTLKEIANFLNVSIDFLLGNDAKLSKDDERLKEMLVFKNLLVKYDYMRNNEDLNNEEVDKIMNFIKDNKKYIKGIN